MPKFIAVKEKTEGPEVPKIQFTTSIDDGDFDILANGELIAWIDSESGRLHLVYFDPDVRIPGLTYDARGRLDLAN